MNKEKDITNFDEHGNLHGFNQAHYISIEGLMYKSFLINGILNGYEERHPYTKNRKIYIKFHL